MPDPGQARGDPPPTLSQKYPCCVEIQEVTSPLIPLDVSEKKDQERAERGDTGPVPRSGHLGRRQARDRCAIPGRSRGSRKSDPAGVPEDSEGESP